MLPNMDDTGMRYGVISQYTILQAWADSSEPYYGEAHCPKCGNEAQRHEEIIVNTENWERQRGAFGDYACECCEYLFDGDEAFPDESLGYDFQDDGYEAFTVLDNDVMVSKSPFYTHAPLCSPCVPNAGNLDDARDDSTFETYCFGHDWFENGIAPYRVYGVVSRRLCFPDAWYRGY